MKRRVLLQFAAVALGSPPIVFAQAEKRYRVGWLRGGRAADAIKPEYRRIFDGFRARMAERGYVEGKNLVLDIRYAEGDATRFPALADELIALKPEVLIREIRTRREPEGCARDRHHDSPIAAVSRRPGD